MTIQSARIFGHAPQTGRVRGFTLIEMMTVIAILGILLAMAVPSFNKYFEKYRTRRAAETVAAFLVNAKSEGVRRRRLRRAEREP